MAGPTTPGPLRFVEAALGVHPRRLLPSVKVGARTVRSDRLVVTVHRRAAEGREAELGAALSSLWSMPPAELEQVIELLAEPGLVSWMHFGADDHTTSSIRKVYLELGDDAAARSDERWTAGTTHVAFKWAVASAPCVVTARYRRHAAVPSVGPRDLVAMHLGTGELAERTVAVIEELVAAGAEITEALDVTEPGQERRSIDLRFGVPAGRLSSTLLVELLDERRVGTGLVERVGRSNVERLALGLTSDDEPFLTIYYTEPEPTGPSIEH